MELQVMSPDPCSHQQQQQIPGLLWEWEGAEGGNPWLQPGMDYLSKLKAAVCSLLHQRSGKNFQPRLPSGKARNLHLNSNGFGKRRKQTKNPTTTTGA